MEKIEWTREIATGIEEIDKQHKLFIKTCSDITLCADRCFESNRVTADIRKLEKIAAAHFSTEEKIMEESHYADKAGHYRLHMHFMDELKQVRSRAEAGETGREFALEIKERLADWFIMHIKMNDMKLVSYIVKK